MKFIAKYLSQIYGLVLAWATGGAPKFSRALSVEWLGLGVFKEMSFRKTPARIDGLTPYLINRLTDRMKKVKQRDS